MANIKERYKYKGEKFYKVKTTREAWDIAFEIMPCEYHLDEWASRRAGYHIYMGESTFNNCPCWISDLFDRLEVNLPDGTSVNIWIENPV